MTTYRQLKQQIADLEKKASIVMKTEVKKVIDSIKKQIAEFGLTAADLGLAVAKRAGAKTRRGRRLALVPKYRDPVSGKTWNGHGKRPTWVVAAQNKGKLDDLLIDKSARGSAKVSAAKPAKKAIRTAKAAPKGSSKRVSAAPAKKAGAKPAAKKAAAKKPAAKKTAANKPAVKAPRKAAAKAKSPRGAKSATKVAGGSAPAAAPAENTSAS